MVNSKKYKFKIKSRKIQLVADKLLLFKLFKKLNGRFWGIYGVLIFSIFMLISFVILPSSRDVSTALSDFGTDIRTAPLFTAALFFAGYGLWKWRNYLAKSSKSPGLVALSITGIIFGLYMVAFLPVGVNDTVERFHYFGFGLAGFFMITTVFLDLLLRKTKKGKAQRKWQFIRIFSLFLIISGAIVTILSADRFGPIINYALVGEGLILLGFATWVMARTYQPEGLQSGFSKVLNKIMIIE